MLKYDRWELTLAKTDCAQGHVLLQTWFWSQRLFWGNPVELWNEWNRLIVSNRKKNGSPSISTPTTREVNFWLVSIKLRKLAPPPTSCIGDSISYQRTQMSTAKNNLWNLSAHICVCVHYQIYSSIFTVLVVS